MFVDVSVRAVINCSLPLLHGLCILLYAITVYFLCCVASLYFTARTLIGWYLRPIRTFARKKMVGKINGVRRWTRRELRRGMSPYIPTCYIFGCVFQERSITLERRLVCGNGHWLCIGRHFNVYFVHKAMVIGPSYVSTASYGIKHSLSTA